MRWSGLPRSIGAPLANKNVVTYTDQEAAMSPTNAKQVVYYYDGDQSEPDVEQDFTGDIVIPSNGSLISRHGKSWKVAHVIEELASDSRVPVFKIFLGTPQSP